MNIKIIFTENDIRRILAEHCRNQFKVDPRNVEIKQIEADVFAATVDGEYEGEIGKA